MTNDNDPEIEHSTLSGPVTRDGITVSVEIYRIRNGSDGWSLEVVDAANTSTVWDETFPTDQDAFQEFQRGLEAEGLPGLLDLGGGGRGSVEVGVDGAGSEGERAHGRVGRLVQ